VADGDLIKYDEKGKPAKRTIIGTPDGLLASREKKNP